MNNDAETPQTSFAPQSADSPTANAQATDSAATPARSDPIVEPPVELPQATQEQETAPVNVASSPLPEPESESAPAPIPIDSITVVPPATPSKKRHIQKLLACIVIALLLLAGIAYAAYHYGNTRGYSNGKNAQATAMTAAALKIPDGTTMISQCTAGEGTQYVLPKNIPQGPIYNVWNNKVTGLEYMLGQSEIANMTTQNLSLMSQNYNHIDVMYEAAGHAGFTEPHYHVILSLISYDQEQKITCGGSSSSSSMSM